MMPSGLPIKPLTPVQRRLIQSASLDEAQELVFQHTVFCQTCLPYRDPGNEVRTWERLNGKVHLEVYAGKAMHPALGRLVPVGLPFGAKPRLVLMHLNAEALRTGSHIVDVERSLSAFVRRLNLDPKGLRPVKALPGSSLTTHTHTQKAVSAHVSVC